MVDYWPLRSTTVTVFSPPCRVPSIPSRARAVLVKVLCGRFPPSESTVSHMSSHRCHKPLVFCDGQWCCSNPLYRGIDVKLNPEQSMLKKSALIRKEKDLFVLTARTAYTHHHHHHHHHHHRHHHHHHHHHHDNHHLSDHLFIFSANTGGLSGLREMSALKVVATGAVPFFVVMIINLFFGISAITPRKAKVRFNSCLVLK